MVRSAAVPSVRPSARGVSPPISGGTVCSTERPAGRCRAAATARGCGAGSSAGRSRTCDCARWRSARDCAGRRRCSRRRASSPPRSRPAPAIRSTRFVSAATACRRLPAAAGAAPTLRLAFIGQLAPHKGVHLAVEAVRALVGRPITLDVHGPLDVYPDYVARLRALAGDDPRIRVPRGVSSGRPARGFRRHRPRGGAIGVARSGGDRHPGGPGRRRAGGGHERRRIAGADSRRRRRAAVRSARARCVDPTAGAAARRAGPAGPSRECGADSTVDRRRGRGAARALRVGRGVRRDAVRALDVVSVSVGQRQHAADLPPVACAGDQARCRSGGVRGADAAGCRRGRSPAELLPHRDGDSEEPLRPPAPRPGAVRRPSAVAGRDRRRRGPSPGARAIGRRRPRARHRSSTPRAISTTCGCLASSRRPSRDRLPDRWTRRRRSGNACAVG